MSQANEDLIRHFLKLWETRDAAGMADCFAEDGVYDNVPEEKPMVGREAIQQWLEMVFVHVDRIEVDIRNIASNGEWVLNERVDDHIHGDKHMPVLVMNASRVLDGKIALFRDYYDTGLVRKVGLLP